MSAINLSENEEMHLLAAARLVEDGHPQPVSLNRVAEQLSIQPISANQMARRLEERGLITYQPYKGVSLTPAGWEITRRILRCRRLWETFLVQRLHTPQAEAEALACRLEHITSDSIAAQLDAYLGSPTASPSGRPIPAGNARPPDPGLPLTLLQAGDRAQVLQLSASPPENAFLQSAGLAAGQVVTLQAVDGRGRRLITLEASGQSLQLSPALCQAVRVQLLIS